MTTKPGESEAAEPVSAAEVEADAAWDEADNAEGVTAIADDDEPQTGDEDGFTSDETDETQTEAEPAAAPVAAPARPDIWANASPEMIAERDRLLAETESAKQRARSEAGRIAAYQRRYEEAQAALKAAKPEVPEEDAEALRAAQEEYPEVVKPLLSRIDRQQAQLDAITQSNRSREDLAAAEREAHEAAETEKLEALMPGYVDLFTVEDAQGNRVESPEYLAWYRTQKPEIRAKIERNAAGIVDAAAAAEALTAYKSFRDRFEAAANPTQPLAASNRRQRQLQASTAVTGRPQTGHVPGIPKDDPDAAWDGYDRLEAQQARAAR
jgi:hypothetical protein